MHMYKVYVQCSCTVQSWKSMTISITYYPSPGAGKVHVALIHAWLPLKKCTSHLPTRTHTVHLHSSRHYTAAVPRRRLTLIDQKNKSAAVRFFKSVRLYCGKKNYFYLYFSIFSIFSISLLIVLGWQYTVPSRWSYHLSIFSTFTSWLFH